MSYELRTLENWLAKDSRVLDLGCGDGSLLAALRESKNIQAFGLEIDYRNITKGIERGINIIEQDIDAGLGNFADQSFSTVIMTQTLQAIQYPDRALEEMLRVGEQGIVTFPNFGHWRCRLHLGTRGRMPVSRFMPHAWYDTPNIHFCTVRDFEALCAERDIRILNRTFINMRNERPLLAKLWPNLFAVTAIYRISK
ncbi:MAG: methionine biosynthesis protein MetW [Pseudomonadales bacterium]